MVTKRARRWLARGFGVALVVALIGFGVAAWFQAGTIASDWLAIGPGPAPGVGVVVSVGAESVSLRDGGGIDAPGTWGLVFERGRAVVTEVTGKGETVERGLFDVTGGLTPGTDVVLDRTVWSMDRPPDSLRLEAVTVNAPVDPLAAWRTVGQDDSWIVTVHGRDAGPEEGLRVATEASEHPVLIGSYRNDPAAPTTTHSRHGYGYDEWMDLEALVEEALRGGGREVVLVGFGSGASIVGAFLHQSELADRVVGVVLDDPVLSLGRAIDADWARRGVPGWMIGWAKALASIRFDLDLGALDRVDADWAVPVLILQSRGEEPEEIALTTDFALAQGPDALLVTFPGSPRGAAWNADPDRYREALVAFLDRVAGGPSEMIPFDES